MSFCITTVHYSLCVRNAGLFSDAFGAASMYFFSHDAKDKALAELIRSSFHSF
jgi:hypothetical protein